MSPTLFRSEGGSVIIPPTEFKTNLKSFNEENKCELENENIKTAIQLWMNGNWYEEICNDIEIETHQTLRLINSFISYNIQTVVSSVIRLKELNCKDYSLPAQIANWSSFLQHGINSQLQLDLIELGLIDRVAVLEISEYLDTTGYSHEDYKALKLFLRNNGVEIIEAIRRKLPIISYHKLRTFINRLNLKNIL